MSEMTPQHPATEDYVRATAEALGLNPDAAVAHLDQTLAALRKADPMTPQHPAAPETDVSALREALATGLHALSAHTWGVGGDYDSLAIHYRREADRFFLPLLEPLLADLDAARERVRVVEGERDDLADRLSELLCDLTGGRMSKTGYSVSTMIQAVEAEFEKHATEDTAALVAEHQWDALERAREADLADARAESAEAAHAAMVKVLGEYFDFDVDPWDDHDAACPAPEDVWRLHRDLRALLAGGAS